MAYIVHVQAIRKPHVIGYVTKYLTKSLSHAEKGVRHEERDAVVIGVDASGKVVEERHTYTIEVQSKARRIRYSRGFFPEKVTDLRVRLFAELEQEAMEQGADGVAQGDTSKPRETEVTAERRSSWSLLEQDEFTDDVEEYRRRRRKVLLEALGDMRAGRNLSRRVISVWAYQRGVMRAARED